jgi:VanZ family protein
VTFAQRAFRRIAWYLTITYWIGLFGVTHIPPAQLPKTNVSDKVEHFTAYAILCGLLHFCLWPKPLHPLSRAAIVIGTAMAYGAFDELTQMLVNRSCSIDDWYADVGGAITAVILMTLLRLAVARTPEVVES